ncbi:MAG TPA: hypothetical protein VIG52_07425 [Methyloceanibacter sp.]|jgi:hypothetical protein
MEAKPDKPDTRTAFEEFTSGASWRELPLKIKLMVLHLWRAERDTPSNTRPDNEGG